MSRGRGPLEFPQWVLCADDQMHATRRRVCIATESRCGVPPRKVRAEAWLKPGPSRAFPFENERAQSGIRRPRCYSARKPCFFLLESINHPTILPWRLIPEAKVSVALGASMIVNPLLSFRNPWE